MKLVPLGEVKAGMVLAQNVVRADGVLLAGQGVEVTEALLRVLERLKVDSVSIEDRAAETPEERAARLELIGKEIEFRFSRVRGDPVLDELKAALRRRAGVV